MCEEKMKTEKSFVAFIDLLGASELIEKNPDESLETIHGCYEEVKKYIAKWEKDSLIIPDIKIFSDNIILSIPLDSDDSDKILFSAMSILVFSMYLQVYFWINDLLVRGAITIGSYYKDEMMAWGNGLVKAHRLESCVAIYPRIVIDPEMDDVVVGICDLLKTRMLTRDFDGIYFVDPYGLEKSSKIFDLLNKFIIDNEKRMLENNGNHKVMQKLNWLQNYFYEKKSKSY